MSESFAFCSSLSVSLASRIGHERVELSSTGLNPALSFRTHRHRRLGTGLNPDRALSRGELNPISGSSSNNHVHEMYRVLRLISALSQLGDLLEQPASLVLVWLSELALRPELREFPAKTLGARPSRPVVEC